MKLEDSLQRIYDEFVESGADPDEIHVAYQIISKGDDERTISRVLAKGTLMEVIKATNDLASKHDNIGAISISPLSDFAEIASPINIH